MGSGIGLCVGVGAGVGVWAKVRGNEDVQL